MSVELFANNPVTVVTSGGTTSPFSGTTETWTVSSPGVFPTASSTASPPTQFHVADVAVTGEVMAVTNTSGGTWTVTRGAESSTPSAHASGFSAELVVSAGALGGFVQVPQMNTAIGVERTRATAAEAVKLQVGGDIGGSVTAPLVSKIQGTAISAPSGTASTYLDGTGHWSAPSGGSMTNPMTASGDTLYGAGSGTPTRLAGNTAAVKKYFTQTGTGSVSAAPAWNTISVGDLPVATSGAAGVIQLAGDLGGTATAPTVSKLQGTTIAAPAGGATAYLNATGGWSVPAGGGGGGGGGYSFPWFNVCVSPYNADNTGTTECHAAIQAAITAAAAAPAGYGVVFLPAGTYLISRGFSPPSNVMIMGDFPVGGTVTNVHGGSVLSLTSGWSGSAVFTLSDVAHAIVNGPTLTGLMVFGGNYTGAAVHGISITGPAMTTLRDMRFVQMSGWGAITNLDLSANEVGSFGQVWENVTFDSNVLGGCQLNYCEDSIFDRVYSIGNNGPAFQITGCDNAKFFGCNAEWSTIGFYVTGDWTYGNGGVQFTGCSTDANQNYGVLIDAFWQTGQGAGSGTGPTPINFTGLITRRDGQSGSTTGAGFCVDYSGVASGYLGQPVFVDNMTQCTGIGDGGTGTMGPHFGVRIVSTGTIPVKIASGLIWGATSAVSTSGTTSGYALGPTVVSTSGGNYASAF